MTKLSVVLDVSSDEKNITKKTHWRQGLRDQPQSVRQRKWKLKRNSEKKIAYAHSSNDDNKHTFFNYGILIKKCFGFDKEVFAFVFFLLELFSSSAFSYHFLFIRALDFSPFFASFVSFFQFFFCFFFISSSYFDDSINFAVFGFTFLSSLLSFSMECDFSRLCLPFQLPIPAFRRHKNIMSTNSMINVATEAIKVLRSLG